MRRPVCAVLFVLSAVGGLAAAQPRQDDLKRLSIEELMQIDVTTAGRREEPIGTTAAAVSVITGDDIRRSGATTIADALQLAEGVHVARVNSGAWLISARGFNGSTPNKLLVMVDGRTVYSPLFAGAFWNTIDYTLEDIDRIEVIRGPGTVLWGANAVNGVVNIITRHSRDTQGAFASIATGNEDPAILDVRYGAPVGNATWRVYGKFAARDAQRLPAGADAGDGRRRGQAGFRVDSAGGGTAWLLKGDAFHSVDDLRDRPPGEFTDLALQGRLTRVLGNGSRVDLQSFYRREFRRIPRQLTHSIDIVDVDLQHTVRWGDRHDIVWGGGVRRNWDETQGGPALQFDPPDRSYAVTNLFVQDEYALLPGRLFTTAGIKYEHNAFSGGELQPNVRGRLMLARNQVVWGAVARAVRRPTRLDDDPLVFAPNGVLLVRGTHEFQAEELVATEFGYRVQPLVAVSLDATVFWHDYDDLRSQDLPPAGGLPLTIGNTLDGRSRGVELAGKVQPAPWLRVHAGYTRLETKVDPQPGSRDVTGGTSEINDPDHIFTLRTSVDLPRRVELDAFLRSIAALPNPAAPGYTELTVRAGWRFSEGVEVSVTGHDLLHAHHREAGSQGYVEFERAIRAALTLRY